MDTKNEKTLSPSFKRKALSYGTLNTKSEPNFHPNTSQGDVFFSDGEETEISPLLQNVSSQSVDETVFGRGGNYHRFLSYVFMSPPFLLPSDNELASADKNMNQKVERQHLLKMEDHLSPEEQAFVGENSRDEQPETKARFTRRDKLTIAMFAAANFCSTVVFSCIAPFYPGEAALKGASDTETGLVFGIFEFVVFVMSPIFGRYLTYIGSNYMYGAGMCVTGTTAILFGLLNWAPAGTPFIALSFTIRIFEAIGNAAFVTAAFAIVARSFPNRVATIVGLLETFAGLGFSAGPPIGGVLYEAGGFQTPFWVLGSLLIVAGLASFFILEKQDDRPTKPAGHIFRLFRDPIISGMVFTIMVAAISISFIDPTFQKHLSDVVCCKRKAADFSTAKVSTGEQLLIDAVHINQRVGVATLENARTLLHSASIYVFNVLNCTVNQWCLHGVVKLLFNMTPIFVGLMFFIIAGVYTLTAPFWGYLIDRKDVAKYVILLGSVCGFVSLNFIGPSPVFNIHKQLWLIGVSELLLGFSLGALFIPPFQQCLAAVKRMGYPETFETYGLVSGLFASSLSFGAFIGPTIGSTSVEYLGFEWTASIISLLHLLVAVIISLLILRDSKMSSPPASAEHSSCDDTDSHKAASIQLSTESLVNDLPTQPKGGAMHLVNSSDIL